MGRLYEQIRKDIEKLRQIDEAIKNNQTVSMDDVFDVSIALQKIEYLITYAEHENKELLEGAGRFPLGELTHFNLPEEFETMVDSWEESLGEERVNHAVNHLQRQSEAETYVPEIMPHDARGYYEYVRGTVDNIARISQRGHFGISRDGVVAMAVSAQQELVKNVFAQDYDFNQHAKENVEVLDFIDNPIEEIVQGHTEDLMLNGNFEVKEFLNAHQAYYKNIVRNSEHPQPFREVDAYSSIAKALGPIHQAKWNAQDLSKGIKDSITSYVSNLKGEKGEVSTGSFLSMARDRIESTLFDHAMVLGDDPNSKFIKDFLADPVKTMEKHFLDLSNDPANSNKEANRLYAEKIRAEQENYNQARQGKVDRFAQIELDKKRAFDAYFNEKNPHFDPATFKHQYQGSPFERFLGRTSKEWTDLSDYIDSWKNIDANRDFDKANDLASKYLRHKFPGRDLKDITPEMCRGLRGAGAERSLFCLSLVQGKDIAEERVHQEIYDQANRRFDQLETRLHRGQSFQDQLADDLAEDNDINQIQNDNEIAKENVIENNNIIIQ